jgi:hypothetical protein
LVTTGTVAEPFADGAGGRFGSGELSCPTTGSSGGGTMPGARVNFGGDEPSAGTTARPSAPRPFAAAPSVPGSPPTGVIEVPEPPDFACVSVIN